jgi:murein L,D-transpeptidase YafK
MWMKLQFYIWVLLVSVFQKGSFQEEQLKYPRVRQAYSDKEQEVFQRLEAQQLDRERFHIYLRAFKSEKIIELWGKNSVDKEYQLIKTYSVCQTSGSLGPKRQQGDQQIPEGFYHVNRFNPYSRFYLSLGLNYPNESDKILGVKNNFGGDIFIHGSCVTIGCLPITDEEIKELYVFCVEAKNNGQNRIPVSIFPMKLTTPAFENLQRKYSSDMDKLGLWIDLKKSFDVFNQTKQLPTITFLSNGRHKVEI